MPKFIKPPDSHKVLVNNINSLCDMQGVSREEQRIIMRMSPATYCRRISNPETFKLGELEQIAKRLNVSVQMLLTERKWCA